MINLIPTSARRRIRTEYWVRVLSVWALTLAAALAIVATLLLPPYVLVTSQEAAYADSAADVAAAVEAGDAAEAALADANAQARRVITSAEQPRFSDLFAIIEAAAPNSVVIDSVAFSRSSEGMIEPIRVQGVAATRQALATFRDALDAQPRVTGVELPISNLASDRDLTFSLTVTVSADSDAS